MSWNYIFGCMKALKVMTPREIKLWFQNKGYITCRKTKGGYADYLHPIGFVETTGETFKNYQYFKHH